MEVVFSPTSEKQLYKLNSRIQQKILTELTKLIRGMRVDIKKLRGKDDEFRIRVGSFRIQIKKISKHILVTKIGKRENFYLVFI